MAADVLQPRKLALSALHKVQRDGHDSDAALDHVFHSGGQMEPRDRAFILLLVMTVLRYRAEIDALLATCLKQPLEGGKTGYVQDVLRLGAAQLLWLETPAHAAVHSSVELVKHSRFRGYAKLVNAVLQTLVREGKQRLETVRQDRIAAPEWLWQSWVADYGKETAEKIAAANLTEPALDITVKGQANVWAERLEAKILPTGSLRRTAGGMIQDLPGYAEGQWWVQDVAAAIPARLLGDISGKKVLDVCAAPGGKTLQLIAAGATVTAVDRSAKRLERMRENLKRMHADATCVTADALEWQPGQLFDAILLDAPCSATGTLRRHPEIGWAKSAKDVEELAQLQRGMLGKVAQWLKPGGVMVYCVCSLEKAEGEHHISYIHNTLPELELVPIQAQEVGGLTELLTPEGALRCLPHYLAEEGGMDGFFALRLRRIV